MLIEIDANTTCLLYGTLSGMIRGYTHESSGASISAVEKSIHCSTCAWVTHEWGKQPPCLGHMSLQALPPEHSSSLPHLLVVCAACEADISQASHVACNGIALKDAALGGFERRYLQQQ